MFTKSVAFYNAIYARRDYQTETNRLLALIERRKRSAGTRLLDVACGTGKHLTFLKRRFATEGLDLDEHMLAIARARHPDVTFHQGDLVAFDLGREFDVVMCLASSIAHVCPGGLLIVEPFLTPERFIPGHVGALFVDQPDLKIARVHRSEIADGVGVMVFHYLVGTPHGVDYFTERHEMGLFSHDTYLAAFRASGLEVEYDAEGLMGRGLYVGKMPHVSTA